ncbi:MAG TPA: DUF4245 domain-containing protein [Nocardioidaceae bacterium]|nr:DUF4245 domain-containing protein [Nocardioidaceae bacterium]
MSEQAGRYTRSTAGLVGAMIVAVAAVVAFVVLRDLNRNDVETEVRAVDYQKVLELSSDRVDFPPVAPATLPEGWKATSVRLTPVPALWHLGVLTDEGRYVGLEQSRSSEGNMVEKYVDEGAVRGGTVDIEGDTWRVWTDEGGDTALTRVEKGVTTLVVGTPDQDVLVDYVESLR